MFGFFITLLGRQKDAEEEAKKELIFLGRIQKLLFKKINVFLYLLVSCHHCGFFFLANNFIRETEKETEGESKNFCK